MAERQNEWVKASDALKRLTEAYGNPTMVKAWLADALRDGDLTARASQTWIADSAKTSFKTPAEPDGVETDIEVPVGYWRQSQTWAADQERWRWPVNQALVTIKRKPARRRIFRGLSFRKSDIDRIAKIRTAQVPQGQKRGPKTAAEKWGLVAAKLVEMVQRGELSPALNPTAHSVATKLKDLTDDCFGDNFMYQFSNSFLRNFERRN